MNIKPTQEAWSALYEEAIRIKKLEPWKMLYDMDLITISLPDQEEPVFCSVMGAIGECYAIGIYPGYESLAELIKLSQEDDTPFAISVNRQNCLMCNFSGREELEKEDLQVIRELGFKFRGENSWIYFRTHDTGYLPWFIDAEQCDIMTRTLRNLNEAIIELMNGLEVDFEAGQTLLRKYDEDSGEWINCVMPMPDIPVFYEKIILEDEVMIRKLKHAEKTAEVLQCDLFHVFMPIQENRSQRPYLPEMVILADGLEKMLINQQMLSPQQDPVQSMLDMLIEYILSNGKPETICVRDKRIAGIIGDLCDRAQIKVEEMPTLPVIDEFIESLMDFVRTQANS